jgi:predicted nucleotidyltransferase
MTSLIAYALDFASFLLEKLGKETGKINSIILFGSVARGEASEKSDIDIFVDLISDEKRMEKTIERIAGEFYESAIFRKYWKLTGVKNEISCVSGRLDEWKDIKRSIISDGIILYGKYKGQTKEGKNYAILSWKSIKPETKRAVFNKKMFGYRHRDKFYKGLMQAYSGEKLDSAILIPIEHANDAIRLFRKMKITVKIRNMREF